MRVAIVAHALRVAGGKSVAINIIQSLIRLYPSYHFLFVIPDNNDYKDLPYPENAQVVSYAGGLLRRVYFDDYVLRSIISKFKPDLVWCLGNFGLSYVSCAQSILVHKAQLVSGFDVVKNETLSNKFKNIMLKQKLKRSLSSTQLVFCQTNVMMYKFKSEFNYAGKVSLLPNAVSQYIDEPDSELVEKIRNRFSGEKLLFVLSRYYSHKNLELLVKCFHEYRRELEGIKCIITIDSLEHKHAKKLLDNIRMLGLDSIIVNVGPINHSEISSYYSCCDALLLPTLLESFSGTYVEAMQYKRPIITSDLDFAKEICGDGALYFNPNEPVDLKNKLLEFFANDKLRDDLVNEGQKRLADHIKSWDEIVSSGIDEMKSIIS